MWIALDPFPPATPSSQSLGSEVGREERKVELVASTSVPSSRQHSPPTPRLMEFGRPLASGEAEGCGGVARGNGDQDTAQHDVTSVQALLLLEGGPWSACIRRPKAGERVQVKHSLVRQVAVSLCRDLSVEQRRTVRPTMQFTG